MCGKVFIKRVIPFFLTFAVGLFIASFFVTIAAPSFKFNRGSRRQHQQYDRMMELEKQRLNEEVLQLKRQLAERELQNLNDRNVNLDFVVPPPPPAPSVRNLEHRQSR
jgi:sensor histidine kinase YesM